MFLSFLFDTGVQLTSLVRIRARGRGFLRSRDSSVYIGRRRRVTDSFYPWMAGIKLLQFVSAGKCIINLNVKCRGNTDDTI